MARDDGKMLSLAAIQGLLDDSESQFGQIALRAKVRRLLTTRNTDTFNQNGNALGTNIPYPYNQTSLAVRTLTAFPQQAAQYYQSRITANRPEVKVVPITQHNEVTQTVDRDAGRQEQLTGELLDAAGLREFQRQTGWSMSTLGCAFGVVMPRDIDFGLPDRESYEDLTDAEVERLKHEGKINPIPRTTITGKTVYRERGDLWAERRKQAMKDHAVSGTSLFTLRSWPLDQARFQNDRDSVRLGPKWIAFIEEIPAFGCMEGSSLARAAAKRNGIHPSLWGEYGLWVKDGKVVGGISLGLPANGGGFTRPQWFTMIHFFDREDYVILLSPMGGTYGAFEVYRTKHHCKVMGAAANPAVEIPFFRTDTNNPAQAYATPIDGVMALTPLINQLMTLRSNAEAFNLIPRLVMELNDANSTLRGEDGQPVAVSDSEVTPGLDPSQIAAYPGKVRQLLIDTANSDNLLKMYLELMAQAMPSPSATGASGETTAWATQITVEQQQATLKEPVDNFTAGIRGIVWRMYGWLRTLDVPVHFYSAPKSRQETRTARALIEFDPKNLTDSIVVEQDIDTADEAIARKQVGLTLWQQTAIDDDEFAGVYLKEQDVRQWRVNRYSQILVNYVAYGAVPANVNPQLFDQSMLKQIADSVRGEVHYALLDQSANYAWASASQQAQQAKQAAMTQQQGLGGEVSQAGGVARPGMGLNAGLMGQMGAAAPGPMGAAMEMANA